jgi:hypothetical protein
MHGMHQADGADQIHMAISLCWDEVVPGSKALLLDHGDAYQGVAEDGGGQCCKGKDSAPAGLPAVALCTLGARPACLHTRRSFGSTSLVQCTANLHDHCPSESQGDACML